MAANKPDKLGLNRPEWEGILRISSDFYEIENEPHITVIITIIPEDDIPFGIARVFNRGSVFKKILNHPIDNGRLTALDMGILTQLDGAYGEGLSSIVEDALVHINVELFKYFKGYGQNIIKFPAS